MRERRWVLVIALLLTVLILAVYFFWRVTRADEIIRQKLLVSVRPFLAQDSDIENLEMDLNGVHLRGVKVIPKDRSFALDIDEVQLGYHLLNFIRYGFVPYKATQQIVLKHPQITVRNISRNSENGLFVKNEGVEFRKIVEGLSPLKRITLVDAELIIEKPTGERLRLAHSLNGWLQTNPVDSAIVRLDGNLFESVNKNLILNGKVNLTNASLVQLNVQIQESEISPRFSFLVPDYIHVNYGKMRGAGYYNKKQGASGYYEIKDGSFSFKSGNLFFKGAQLRGDLKNRDIFIQGQIPHFNGSPLTVSGTIKNILDPLVSLNVESPQFNIKSFFKHTLPGSRLQFSGNARFHLSLNGTLNNPEMTGNFIAPDLEIYGSKWNRFLARIHLKDSLVTLTGMGEQKGGLKLDLWSTLDLTKDDPVTNARIYFNGNSLATLPDWYRKKVENSQLDFDIRINGKLKRIHGKASGEFILVTFDKDTIHYLPSLIYANKKLDINIRTNRKFQLMGEINHPFTEKAEWYLTTGGFSDLFFPFMNERRRLEWNGVSMNGTLFGTPAKWFFKTEGQRNENGNSFKIFDCRIEGQKEENKPLFLGFSGNYYGYEDQTLPFYARCVLTTNELWVRRFEVGDFIKSELHYPLEASGRVSGLVKLNNFNLDKLHPFIRPLNSFRGNLSGEVSVAGTREHAEWKVDLGLQEGWFHEDGPFHGELMYESTGSDFRFCRVFFYKNSSPIIVGSTEKTSMDSLKGEFRGENVDIGNIISALTGKQNILRGRGAFNISVAGKPDDPFLVGSMRIQGGEIEGVSFREMWMDFADTLYTRHGLLSGTLNILGGWLVREDGLTVRVSGRLPHYSDKETDISIYAKGNILGWLPELSSFIRKSEGDGELFLRLGGKAGSWVIGKAQLQLNSGKMEFASFIKRIDNLSGMIRIHPEERFVEILDLSGNIDGETLTVANGLVDESSSGLEPLVFEGLGIQLGYLRLRTNGKGIHVHLPGLMEPGEKGWIKMAGSSEEEPLIVAGPISNPLIRGTFLLTTSQFTYPFLSVDKEEDTSGKLIDFLESVNWDMKIIPRKDVHYVRNFSSAISNAYLDLLLKDGYGDINLQGMIQDESLEVWGNLVSTEGTIEFLDHYFRPERITFDYPKGTVTPILAGRGSSTVIDSTGMPSTVWLSLTTVDKETGLEKEGGNWKEIKFRLSTDNPNLGRTEADLLAALGYSAQDFKERAYDALGMRLDNIVFRPIFRPIEKSIRHHLGFDVVRFFSMFSRNIAQLQSTDPVSFDPKILLKRTRLMLGKYLAPGLFVTYSGEVQEGLFRYHSQGLGFRHALTLEYTIRPDLFLEMEYTYDSQLLSDRREDKRLWIRHIFPF